MVTCTSRLPTARNSSGQHRGRAVNLAFPTCRVNPNHKHVITHSKYSGYRTQSPRVPQVLVLAAPRAVGAGHSDRLVRQVMETSAPGSPRLSGKTAVSSGRQAPKYCRAESQRTSAAQCLQEGGQQLLALLPALTESSAC